MHLIKIEMNPFPGVTLSLEEDLVRCWCGGLSVKPQGPGDKQQ